MALSSMWHRFSVLRPGRQRYFTGKLRTRLQVTLIPAALIVLLIMGLATYWTSSEFIAQALERTSRMHAVNSAQALTGLLQQCQRHLLRVAASRPDAETLGLYLADLRAMDGLEFMAFGFIPLRSEEPVVYVGRRGESRLLSREQVASVRPNPMLLYEHVRDMQSGEVWVSEFSEVEAPFPTSDNPHGRMTWKAIRMITPCDGPSGERIGFVYLSVSASMLRNVLSLYDSPNSPVFAFGRNPKFQRYTYFFDSHGWVLFQSDPDQPDEAPLRTLKVRTAYQGTLGRPGFPEAFRPAEHNEDFWQLVADVKTGGKGIVRPDSRRDAESPFSEHFLAYAPVSLRLTRDGSTTIIGGVAYEDRSVLVDLAGYRLIDITLAIIVISVLILMLVITLVARSSTRGLMELTDAVKGLTEAGSWTEVQLRRSGYEAEMLKDSINAMIRTIHAQFEEIRSRDQKIESVELKEPVELTSGMHDERLTDDFPELVGDGPLMKHMKRDIIKAAQVDVDVLIEGETGTGKQLAAEAVHRLSQRNSRPFISINCGELDENLLLDSLFGHVRGAFTDGKGDRRGAFLEADGGSLFLDEIQSASLKVQQALLRALSLRKIKPLGSDRDIDVDVRLITATNADLKALIAVGDFREDLYYRLKVVTISTPPLRDQRQNIPQLAMHFLQEGEHMAGRRGLALSRGALKTLVGHNWPGNIRELKHVIITAAVMSEGRVIQAEQLGIDGHVVSFRDETPQPLPWQDDDVPEADTDSAGRDDPQLAALNPRQVRALEYVREHGRISCRELCDLVEGGISKRTAGYDLQDLLARGLLERRGKGPATCYVVLDGRGGHS